VLQLQIETINHCNAACVFCPYPRMTRPKGIMADHLFCKIITEAVGIPQISQVTLTGLGEPLLDPHIISRVALIHQLMPRVTVDLYTNGSYLRPAMSEALADAGITDIYVSLNATTRDKRLQIMRLDDYNKVIQYIAHAASLKKFRIIVKGIVTKDLMENDEPDQFRALWGEAAFLHLEGNWAGEMWPVRIRPTAACSRALRQIMVLQDGRVSLCCFDSEGDVVFGDLNHQTIKEVFNGPLALSYREAHSEGRRSKMKLCATCTAI
jgi:organic radical activating enzyme